MHLTLISTLRRALDPLFKYPALIAILASVWWFYIGYDDLQQGKRKVGLQWQLLGVALSLGFSIGAVFSKMWISSTVAFPVASIEIILMLRWYRGAGDRNV